MGRIGPPYTAVMYYGHGSWIIVVIPLALLALRALSTGRRGRGAPRRPPAPPSFFVGDPSAPGTPPPAPSGNRQMGTTKGTPADWCTDPFVKHEQRYWSGAEWTEHVLDDGVPGNDPPPPPRAGDGP
jgi:Protein of unknown function (DUF2510)